jgi:hypothetical protein
LTRSANLSMLCAKSTVSTRLARRGDGVSMMSLMHHFDTSDLVHEPAQIQTFLAAPERHVACFVVSRCGAHTPGSTK